MRSLFKGLAGLCLLPACGISLHPKPRQPFVSAFDPDSQAVAPAQSAAPEDEPDVALRARVAQFIKQRERLPNSAFAVAVVHQGKIVLSEGFGWSDRALHSAVTPHTVFGLGDLRRSFVAMGVALLAEQGRLDFKLPVSRAFPAFEWDTVEATQRLTPADLLAIPEDRAYAVLQTALEQASGLLWDEFLEREIRQPLKLDDLAADGQQASVTDLARWLRFWVARGALPSQRRLVSPGVFETLLRGWSVKNPTEFRLAGTVATAGTGACAGYSAVMALQPEQKAGVAVLSQGPGELSQALADYVLTEPAPSAR